METRCTSLALLVLMILCNCGLGQSTSCYQCSTCPTNQVVVHECMGCKNTYGYVNYQIAQVIKSCVAVCSPMDNRVDGNGAIVTCCYSNYCNSAPATAKWPLSLFVCFLLFQNLFLKINTF
ncbi:hypothetical protein Ciccas_012715 [Cichlidogyrus casuarinus]|uniref:Uncharacterized protein n=1 Tax=Cichlidogyrus casuarinus TaxID=1844966 RepID=A0ABD2PMJ4_9PLAT